MVYGSEKASPSYIGVVDMEKLLKLHKDWNKLNELDKHVQSFEEEFSSPDMNSNIGKLQKDAEKKFKSLVLEYDGRLKKKNEELQGSWTSEQDSIMKQLQTLQDKYSTREKAEMEKIKADHKAELDNLEKEFEGKMAAEMTKQSSLLHEKYKPELDK
jgi:hypothetical protein